MALRYGTIPIVRETGGLKDTVQPYNEFENSGTGFSFVNYNAHEMLNTIRYIILAKLIHDISDQVKSLLIRQPGYNTYHHLMIRSASGTRW